MAEIKRHAAGLADENRWDDIDWTEYHENESRISEKIGHMKQAHKNKKKAHGKKGGDEFRKTAERYEAKSAKYRAKGMNDISALYARQAEIKRDAAEMGDEGRWEEIDWSEYEENESQIKEKIMHVKQARKSKHENTK